MKSNGQTPFPSVTAEVVEDPPTWEFDSISTGSASTCGVKRDGLLSLLGGWRLWDKHTTRGRVQLHRFGTGPRLRGEEEGTVTCWGRNTDLDGGYLGQAAPPKGEFSLRPVLERDIHAV